MIPSLQRLSQANLRPRRSENILKENKKMHLLNPLKKSNPLFEKVHSLTLKIHSLESKEEVRIELVHYAHKLEYELISTQKKLKRQRKYFRSMINRFALSIIT